jgi:hypothetical protein
LHQYNSAANIKKIREILQKDAGCSSVSLPIGAIGKVTGERTNVLVIFPNPLLSHWSLPSKQDLPIDITFYITFDPPHFSLYNTFKLLANRILGTVPVRTTEQSRINMLFLEES